MAKRSLNIRTRFALVLVILVCALVEQRITMSVGIAVLPDHAIDGDSLEKASDRALYVAKNSGRDRAEVFNATSDVRVSKA